MNIIEKSFKNRLKIVDELLINNNNIERIISINIYYIKQIIDVLILINERLINENDLFEKYIVYILSIIL